MRILTCAGDAGDIKTHGGLPYFLMREGQRRGFIDDSWRLRKDKLNIYRVFWNLAEYARTGQYGGFQYSEYFLKKLEAQVPPSEGENEIISIYPLFPVIGTREVDISFYIDATCSQVFDYYGMKCKVSPRIYASTIARERDQYAAATRVLCRSAWAAQSVVEQYGISPSKVHIVPGGANLHEPVPIPVLTAAGLRMTPVRLAFVGRDWHRKGLPFLLEVADHLSRRGTPCEVVAAGFDRRECPPHPQLRAVGIVHKRDGSKSFIDLVRSCHFGCSFSEKDASPRANSEFLRLGIPVLARDTGGMRDTVPDGCGHVFPKETSADAVADVVSEYIAYPEQYALLQANVVANADKFAWGTTIDRFIEIWSGVSQYSYAKEIGNYGPSVRTL